MPLPVALLWACSRGPSVEATPEQVVPLCSPWSGWDLPEAPTVVHCDPRHLTIHLPPSSADAAAPAWRLAVRAAGWLEDVDSSAPGLVNVRYTSDEGGSLDLSLIDDTEYTLLVLTRVDRANR
jgi:hypothetical protein